MLRVFPDYYKDFKCIADKCRHSCCIGWEIDIDKNTLEFYKSIKGDLSLRLKNGIFEDGSGAHFKLSDHDRCPFLNKDGLCDIIIELGEEHISDICKLHPRFTSDLPGRIETGIGLCCEEAARIILGKKEPVKLIFDGKSEVFDEIIDIRDRAIDILQDRCVSLDERIKNMLSLFDIDLPEFDICEAFDLLLSLERLDESWTEVLKCGKAYDSSVFDEHMMDRQYEYENFIVYLIYRHMANAPDIFEAGIRALFAAFSYEIINKLGAGIFYKNGKFDFSDQIELIRLFSSEIEYSDENLNIIFDYLADFIGG